VKKAFFVLILIPGLVFCGSARAVISISGHITVDTLWNNTTEVYQLTGNLYIDPNVTLTLASGVTLRSPSYECDIYVDGHLEADGATATGIGTATGTGISDRGEDSTAIAVGNRCRVRSAAMDQAYPGDSVLMQFTLPKIKLKFWLSHYENDCCCYRHSCRIRVPQTTHASNRTRP
jgi:hypothetical protein